MSAEKNLQALSDTLARITRASIVGGFGPTFVTEIKQIDRAIKEIKRLRNANAALTSQLSTLNRAQRTPS